jgi:ribonuclease PH
VPEAAQALETSSLAADLRAALTPALLAAALPKSVIEVSATVLQHTPAVAAALVAAGSLALADAGVPCCDLVAAARVASADASTLVAVCPVLQRVTLLRQDGPQAPEEAAAALTAGVGAAVAVGVAMRRYLLDATAQQLARAAAAADAAPSV